MTTVVCVGIGLVPVADEKSDERVLVAEFAPMDSPVETLVQLVIKDAALYTVGNRYALTLAEFTAIESDDAE